MKDGAARRAVKRIALWHFTLNLAAHRSRRRDKSYLLGGDCRRCARCCEAPAIRANRLVWCSPLLRRLFLWWQKQVNGFELTGHDDGSRTFVFRCTHFDWTTRSCDSYDSRPGMCRDYPRLLLYQPSPEFLPGCGYRAVAPNAEALRAALDGQALTPEQRAKLHRDLYLDG